MIGDILKAVSQVFDGRFLSVLFKSLLWTFAIFAVLFLPFWGVFSILDGIIGGLLGVDLAGLLGGTLTFLAAGFWVWMASLLMFPVAAIIVSFFLEDIVSAVEAKHYPQLPKVKEVTVGDAIGSAIGFTLALIGLNLLALLIYPFTGPFSPLLFWALNGYLLGREYFEIVAMRRLRRRDVARLRGQNSGEMWLMGILMVIPLTVPILGFLIPVLGVAAFTHFYHRVSQGFEPSPEPQRQPGTGKPMRTAPAPAKPQEPKPASRNGNPTVRGGRD